MSWKLVYFVKFLSASGSNQLRVGSIEFNTEDAAKTIGRWLEGRGDTTTMLVYDPPLVQMAAGPQWPRQNT